MKTINLFNLLLPILFPSWRFFSGIGVSPRFDVGVVNADGDVPSEWIPFRPLPKTLSLWQQVKQFVHNPQWNELLFLNSCAERIFEGYQKENSDFYLQEIAMHLLLAVRSGEISAAESNRFMCFRIRAIYSEDTSADRIGLVRDEVVFQSGCYALPIPEGRV
ncbi:hypothetical protein [Cellvibrio sp. NN19]|uniref:hypothetical protein n=1 Tax=Cellvibrio chitinivorans TaxID=3102792 RepID=UPI002B418226|nr:hypothetical protein [Cellvibrio sp. NN19]